MTHDLVMGSNIMDPCLVTSYYMCLVLIYQIEANLRLTHLLCGSLCLSSDVLYMLRNVIAIPRAVA